jgi:hypothetical protein
MKRRLFCLGLIAIVSLGCSFFSGATQTGTAGPELIGTAQPNAPKVPGATDEPVAEQPAGKPAQSRPTNTTCKELAFFLDSELASDIQCFTAPEASGVNPSYTKVVLVEYDPSGRMMQPVLSILPIQSYKTVLPDIVGPDVTMLEELAAGSEPGGADLPLLPVQDGRQLFFAHYKVLQFQNGTGVRFITQYNQTFVPPNSHDLFYAFQGLTSDGQYWVSVILPTTHPSLWETAGAPTSTEYKTINKDPAAYYAMKTDLLNTYQPRSFVPSLEEFDALVQSILVKP